jgi:alpha-tubulin suppressor-like RCC1 family protein
MVYNAQDCWVLGFRLSLGVLENTNEHNVSETESVYVLSWGVGDTYSVGSVTKSYPVIEVSSF